MQISRDELAYRCQPSLTALFKLADGLEVGPDELLKAVKIRLRKEERAATRLGVK